MAMTVVIFRAGERCPLRSQPRSRRAGKAAPPRATREWRLAFPDWRRCQRSSWLFDADQKFAVSRRAEQRRFSYSSNTSAKRVGKLFDSRHHFALYVFAANHASASHLRATGFELRFDERD